MVYSGPSSPTIASDSSRMCSIQPVWFYRIAYTGMAFTGAKLLWDGLR